MKEKKFEVFCEHCGAKVGFDLPICPNCKSKLGDIECPNCNHVGSVSEFTNGCPNCSYNPFEELKEKPFKRKQKIKSKMKNLGFFRPLAFGFSLSINIFLYLLTCFFTALLFIYILFY